MPYVKDPATGKYIFTQDPTGTSVQRPAGGSFTNLSQRQQLLGNLVQTEGPSRQEIMARLQAPQPQPQPQLQPQSQSQPQQTFMGRLARTGGNILKEIALSPVRLLASPFAILSEELPALTQGRPAQSTALSRFAFRGTEPGTYERSGAAAERALDAATLLVGGGAVSQTGKVAAGKGLGTGLRELGRQTIRTAPADIALGAGFGATSGMQEGKYGKDLLAPTALGAGLGLAAPLAFGAAAKGAGALVRGVRRGVQREAPAVIGRLGQEAIETPMTARTFEQRLQYPTTSEIGQQVTPESLFRKPRTTSTPLPVGQPQRTAAVTPVFMAGVTKAEKMAAMKTGVTAAGKAAGELDLPKYVGGINTRTYADTPEAARKFAILDEALRSSDPEYADIKRVMKDRTVEQAKRDADAINPITREESMAQIASVDKADDLMHALANGETGLGDELKDLFKTVSSWNSHYGRALRRRGVRGESVADTKIQILGQLEKKVKNFDEMWDKIKLASKDVDFDNPKQVIAFYRKYVQPSWDEKISELRYINLLSSFKTHNINAFSNLLQTSVTAPVTKLTTGAIDFVAASLTGRQRKAYVNEVPAYYKGVFNSIGTASKDALKVFRGEKWVQRPDVDFLPTGSKLTSWGMFIPRALEAGDIFFRTLVKGGETNALTKRAMQQGKKILPKEIEEEAERKAKYYIFRGDVDPTGKLTGQGTLLQQIDKMTNLIYKAREMPGIKWVIPFVQTPMNILKQGIEYSPAGFATIIGAKDKQEQLAKAIIGSFVMAGAGAVIASTDSTWSVPSNKKERDAFYASGRKPYSIKIGDTWVSYSKLGPLAYPIALASAVKYYSTQDPKRFDKSAIEKIQDGLGATLNFYADQSYLQGIQQLIDLTTGEPWEKKQAAINFTANFTRQVIPLSSLQGYVARIIDPVYRQAKTVPEKVMSGIPGLSTYLEPYTTPTGEEERRTNPFLNALTPFGFQQAKPEYETDYQQSQGARSFIQRLQETGEPIQPTVNRYRASDPDFFRALQKEQQYLRFNLTNEERELVGMGVDNGERARAIYGMWVNLPEEQRGPLLGRLRATGILTTEVMRKLSPLLTTKPI